MTTPHVELFTDGACSGNPGPGGWAFILRENGEEVIGTGGLRRTTNNQMELMAVIEGLQRLEDRCRVDLYSDSQYVVLGLKEWLEGWKRRGWKRSGKGTVKNLDLWKTLDELKARHDLNPIWVRGHNEHPENERCDELAVATVERVRKANQDIEPQFSDDPSTYRYVEDDA